MTMTDEQVLTVEQAEANLDAAREYQAELETRLRDGDLSIGIEAITEAGQRVGFAELRLEGARSAAARRELESRRQTAAMLQREVVATTARSSGELVELYDQATRSLAELARAVAEDNARSLALSQQIEAVLPSEIPNDEADFRQLNHARTSFLQRLSPARLVLAAVHESLGDDDDFLNNQVPARSERDFVRFLRVVGSNDDGEPVITDLRGPALGEVERIRASAVAAARAEASA